MSRPPVACVDLFVGDARAVWRHPQVAHVAGREIGQGLPCRVDDAERPRRRRAADVGDRAGGRRPTISTCPSLYGIGHDAARQHDRLARRIGAPSTSSRRTVSAPSADVEARALPSPPRSTPDPAGRRRRLSGGSPIRPRWSARRPVRALTAEYSTCVPSPTSDGQRSTVRTPAPAAATRAACLPAGSASATTRSRPSRRSSRRVRPPPSRAGVPAPRTAVRRQTSAPATA